MIRKAPLLLVPALLLGCTSEPAPEAETAAGDRYQVDIRWTSYGIPHVKADDWGSLGYGFAYATARDGVCVFAREVARANGTMSADFAATSENLAALSGFARVRNQFRNAFVVVIGSRGRAPRVLTLSCS